MDDERGGGDGSARPNRRRFLKGAGAAVVGVAAATGTASAHQYMFYGCQRLCGDTDGDLAVVATGDGFECRPLSTQSDRDDVSWDWGSHCYEAAAGETIVGAIEEETWQGRRFMPAWNCELVVNPNHCADEHYESARQVRTALNAGDSCGTCAGNIILGDGGNATGTDYRGEPSSDGPQGRSAQVGDGNATSAGNPAGDGTSTFGAATDGTDDVSATLREVGHWLARLVTNWR